ncbi:chemotaxis protein [Alteromonas sp. KC3]|uniref:methyl-accepting chemotaxis protein n=1 Tax=unclassified Alteromonas TaxID=2614992 RepID=UPI001920A4A3|nr:MULTISPECIES: methyl-accepting chemotaxis protein [unclassified Alteromonas]BCO18565.1 chemotaxis protein [Alteromonas sp. KC3]BCO22526.1 chemotaxis protein [Alteromonas sp. KC14]
MVLINRLSVVQLTLIGTGTLFLSIAFLAFKDINQSRTEMVNADLDTDLVTLVSAVERVAHHHAVERGLTAGFLGNPTEEARAKVRAQREKADNALDNLRTVANGDWPETLQVNNILNPLYTWENNKGSVRSNVDNLQGKEAFKYYSGLNSRALNAANSFTLLVSDSSAKQLLTQGLLLAQMKEKLGQRRGKLNAVMAKRSISEAVRDEVEGYNREITYVTDKLLLNLSDDFLRQFKAMSSSSVSERIDDISARAIQDSPDFTTLPSSSEWFGMATEQIGQVAKILGTVFEQVKQNADDKASSAYSALIITILMVVLVIVFIAIIYQALISIITKQLKVLVANLDKIAAQGDLTVDVSMSTSNELGEISRSVNTTILALRDLVKGLGTSIATSSRLSAQLEKASSEMLKDAGNTQQLTANIASAVEQVAVTSREIAQSSLDTLSASKQLDELANQSLKANQNIRNSMETLADDIKGVQKNAGEMEMKVGEISTILETINTLSDQTNLLALNAAIEAARAGEHGRGFAVVADEVRKLAQSSRESSDKISTLLSSLREASVVVVNDINKNVESISNSMETTTEGRKTAEKVKEAAGNVEDMANNMSSAAEQQSVTTEEIAKELVTVEEAARHEVDIAQNLSNLSGEMQANNQLLQHTIDGFKAD